jgi:outer membrane protein assembly factor BamB
MRPWPMRGLCSLRRNTSKFVGSQTNVSQWSYGTDAIVRSSPSIAADGSIYIASDDFYVYALNPSGTLKWRYRTGGIVRSSPALAANGNLYAGSGDGYVYALDMQTGALRWRTNTGTAVYNAAAVAPDGTVYIGSDNRRLYALDPASGAVRFSYLTGGNVNSSPAILKNGVLVFGSDDNYLYALKPDLGLSESQRLLWRTNLGSDINTIPAIGPAPDHAIYVLNQTGKLFKLSPSNGQITAAYTGPTTTETASSPAIGLDGNIYVGIGHNLYAFAPDLTAKWSLPFDSDVMSSPAVGADGTLYVGVDDQRLYALRTNDGTTVWAFKAGNSFRSSPSIGKNGTIYVGNDDKKVYSIGTFTCDAQHPCGEGTGSCTSDAGCESGLTCGFGIAGRYGLPAEFGVCWDPSECATLGTTECGTFTSKCGTCCTPECGAAGSPDGCGGVCRVCLPGADSDHDGVPDCDEQNDADAWTDPLILNGVIGQRGAACATNLTCAQIDTRDELAACFAPVESTRLRSGWDFDTSDTNACQSGFGFDHPFQGCAGDFGVGYEGAIRLETSGVHCFAVSGSTAGQCGALFLDQSSTALTSAQGPLCLELPAGIYPLEAAYQTTNHSANSFHLQYCFGGDADCTPTQAIPKEMLRPLADSTARICESDAGCSELCPCDRGAECESDPQCNEGLACRSDVASRFNKPAGTHICWDPECDDMGSALFECGTLFSRCGVCPACTPDCAGKSCGYDGCWGTCGGACSVGQTGCTKRDDCGSGLSCMLGDSGTNVCLPDYCEHPAFNPCSDLANAGELTECGRCAACTPDCDGRECGPAPNGCGMCGNASPPPGQFCTNEGELAIPVLLHSFSSIPDEGLDEGANTPGTLPGAFDVSRVGQATYRIPIQVAPGRNGIEPSLALTYNTAGGNGYVGMGWGLDGLSAIQRCPANIAQDGAPAAITYTEADRFCLDGNRLVSASSGPAAPYGGDGNVEYRTQLETFSRIRSVGGRIPGEPASFTVWTRDGRIMTYDFAVGGNTPLNDQGVRIADFAQSNPDQVRTQSWLLSKVEDRFGNSMRIKYEEPASELSGSDLGGLAGVGISIGNAVLSVVGAHVREYYPSAIEYTAHDGLDSDRRVEFHYRPRRDVLEGFQKGVRFERSQVLDQISAFAQGQVVFQYDLNYAEPAGSPGNVDADAQHQRTLLTSIRQCARGALDGGAELACKPSTHFEYSEVKPGFAPASPSSCLFPQLSDDKADLLGRPLTLDLDGNGQQDVLYARCSEDDCSDIAWHMFLNGEDADDLRADSARMRSQFGNVISAGSTYVVDYDLDGLDDVLEVDAENRSARDGEIRRWSFVDGMLRNLPTGIFLGKKIDGGEVYMLDANGDGAVDMLTCTPTYVREGRGGTRRAISYTWERRLHDHHGFGESSVLTKQGPACQPADAMDLNGDGQQELLLNTSPYGRTVNRNHFPTFIAHDASAVFWPMTGLTTDTVLPAVAKDAVRLVQDVNGDGLPDVVEVDDDLRVTIWHNSGAGFVSNRSSVSLAEIRPSTYDGKEFVRQLRRFGTAFDENGDGRTDLLAKLNDSLWIVLRSHGDYFSVHLLRENETGETFGPRGGEQFLVYDSNQDGMADLADCSASVHVREGTAAQRLIAVTNGLGARTEIEYKETEPRRGPALGPSPRSRLYALDVELRLPDLLPASDGGGRARAPHLGRPLEFRHRADSLVRVRLHRRRGRSARHRPARLRRAGDRGRAATSHGSTIWRISAHPARLREQGRG